MLLAVVLWVVAFAIILVASIKMIRRAVIMNLCAVEVAGEIIEVKELFRRRIGIITREYLPTIAYNANGNAYSRSFTKSHRADTYYVGKIISVSYNPHKPEEINTLGTSNNADFVRLVIGIIIGVIGVSFW